MSEPARGTTSEVPPTTRWGWRSSLATWYLVLFAIGTLFAWAHTLDEIRIGQLIAVPFAIANSLAVAGWSRLQRGQRIAVTIAFGLLWMVTAIPYHVLPLIHGAVTWQNVSGMSRIAAGAIMVATGLALAARRPSAH